MSITIKREMAATKPTEINGIVTFMPSKVAGTTTQGT